MRKMFRSALTRTALAFLLTLPALGSAAHAGGFTACDAPFIFEGAAANIVPIEYVATTADQGADDRLAALQATAQRLAWLIKLDSWHQPTYGSLGVVAHMFLGRQCDPDEVLEQLLRGGGGPPMRPGQILLLVHGKIFIEGEQIFLQTRLRGFRRNLEELGDGNPLASYRVPETIGAPLLGNAYRVEAGLPDLDITFAPRAMTTAEFEEIDQIFAQASRLYSEPSEDSPSQALGFEPGATRAFQIEIVENGAWLKVQDMLSGLSGYIHSDPDASRFLHDRMPELDLLNAMLGYLRVRQADASLIDFPPPPSGSAERAHKSLQAFLEKEHTSDEVEARALAFALMAALEITSQGDWISARSDLSQAVGLTPYKSEYRNMLGVIDTYLCCTGSPVGEYGDPARAFAEALSLAPDNVEALKNLDVFLNVLGELSLIPAGINASRLDDRREVVQSAVTSISEGAP